MIGLQGEEVAKSHKVQSVRAVVEQTIADLKLAKVMEGNKISTVSDFEEVLEELAEEEMLIEEYGMKSETTVEAPAPVEPDKDDENEEETKPKKEPSGKSRID